MRSYVLCRMDVVILFLVKGGIILLNVPDTPGVSMALLRWEIFCVVIAGKRLVGSVIDDVLPVEVGVKHWDINIL